VRVAVRVSRSYAGPLRAGVSPAQTIVLAARNGGLRVEIIGYKGQRKQAPARTNWARYKR